MRNTVFTAIQTTAYVGEDISIGNAIDFVTGVQWGNAIRILSALCLAPIGTFGLLLLMHTLIDNYLPEPEPTTSIFTKGIFDIPEEAPIPPPEELTPPEDVLPPPEIPRFTIEDQGGSILLEPLGPIGNGGDEIRNGLFDNDAPIQLVAVAPQYPATDKEGYVDVRFDITRSGTTTNIEIVAYEPSKVFNRSVLRAVAKWRYQPRLVEGEPVETKGVMERIRFKLEK